MGCKTEAPSCTGLQWAVCASLSLLSGCLWCMPRLLTAYGGFPCLCLTGEQGPVHSETVSSVVSWPVALESSATWQCFSGNGVKVCPVCPVKIENPSRASPRILGLLAPVKSEAESNDRMRLY